MPKKPIKPRKNTGRIDSAVPAFSVVVNAPSDSDFPDDDDINHYEIERLAYDTDSSYLDIPSHAAARRRAAANWWTNARLERLTLAQLRNLAGNLGVAYTVGMTRHSTIVLLRDALHELRSDRSDVDNTYLFEDDAASDEISDSTTEEYLLEFLRQDDRDKYLQTLVDQWPALQKIQIENRSLTTVLEQACATLETAGLPIPDGALDWWTHHKETAMREHEEQLQRLEEIVRSGEYAKAKLAKLKGEPTKRVHRIIKTSK